MRKSLVLFVVAVFVLLTGFSAFASLGPILDQSQEDYDTGMRAGSIQSLCQTFTAGTSGNLVRIDLYLTELFPDNQSLPATISVVSTIAGSPNDGLVLWTCLYFKRLYSKVKVMWEILHSFKEVMNKDVIVWFKRQFECVRDGVGHSISHPEVETHIHVVRKAIEESDEVRQDKRKSDNKCYYSWFVGDEDYQNQFMKAVVARTWFGTLVVATAYFTAKVSPSEKIIWKKQ